MPSAACGTRVRPQRSRPDAKRNKMAETCGGSPKAGGQRAILFARHAVAEPRKALALTTDHAGAGSPESEPEPRPRPGLKTRRGNKARAMGMTVAAVVGVLGLTGCTNNSFTRLGFPNP